MYEKFSNILINRLSRYTYPEIEEGYITLNSDIFRDLRADNFDLVKIISDIEAVFGIRISLNEMKQLATVENIMNYIMQFIK